MIKIYSAEEKMKILKDILMVKQQQNFKMNMGQVKITYINGLKNIMKKAITD